jgi:guanylate kinase
MQILEQRLRGRKTESEEKIQMRISKAQIEMDRAAEFDAIIENNILEQAIEQVKAVAAEFVNR